MIQAIDAHEDKVWGLHWSQDGLLIATCSSDKRIKIWGKGADAFECKTSLEGGHSRTVRAVAWKPHCVPGDLVLASAGFDA